LSYYVLSIIFPIIDTSPTGVPIALLERLGPSVGIETVSINSHLMTLINARYLTLTADSQRVKFVDEHDDRDNHAACPLCHLNVRKLEVANYAKLYVQPMLEEAIPSRPKNRFDLIE